MKVKKDGIDFSFLNKAMYIAAFIGLYFFLKNLGIMDKIIAGVVALTPVYIGIIICWISMPLVKLLKKIGLNKNLAAIIALVIMYLIIIVVLSVTIPIFIKQLTNLVKELPNIYSSVVSIVNEFLRTRLNIQNGIDVSQTLKSIDITQELLTKVMNYSINTVQTVINVIVSIFTSIVVSFFMAKDMDKFKEGLIAFFSRNSKNDRKYKMITEMEQEVMSYVKGILIESFIVGLITTVVCIVLKLDYAVIFGILVMLLNFVPYIGALLSYIIVSLYALAVGGPTLAIITLISMIAIQLFDVNILQPNIVAKSVKIHPVLVFSGLIVFELLFGVVGMVIAIPILAIGKVYIKYKFNLDDEESTIKIDDENAKRKNNLTRNKIKK